MTEPVSREVIGKIRRLAQLPEEAKHCQFAVSITRLTVLKSLCREPEVASRFVTYLARRIRQKVEGQAKRPGYLAMAEWKRHREMIGQGVTALEQYLEQPSEDQRSRLRVLFRELSEEQNAYRYIHGGPVRMIKNNDLLLVEYALSTVLADEDSAPVWAYQTARHYAERYDGSYGTGLTPKSASLVQDIVDFWMQELGLTPEALNPPPKQKKASEEKLRARSAGKRSAGKGKKAEFTPRQGQFLAFIHLYRKLHRQGPAEPDMAKYFRVTPPSVHGMVVKLAQLGLVTREAGVPRSVRVAIPEEEIPKLEEVQGPPW
jgi:hypothetical protein